MIRKILADWPVDPARTLLIGDKQSDLAAPAEAGVSGRFFTGGDLAQFLTPLLGVCRG